LTNLEEEKFMRSEIGKDYMASAIYRAFKDYKVEIESRIIPLEIEVKTQTATENSVSEESEAEDKEYKREEKEGLVFKVQLVTSSKNISTEPENFHGLSGVEYYKA